MELFALILELDDGRVTVPAYNMTVTECFAEMELTPGSECYYVPPCPTEDSGENCIWDAEKRGNGRGRSFMVIGDFWVEL